MTNKILIIITSLILFACDKDDNTNSGGGNNKNKIDTLEVLATYLLPAYCEDNYVKLSFTTKVDTVMNSFKYRNKTYDYITHFTFKSGSRIFNDNESYQSFLDSFGFPCPHNGESATMTMIDIPQFDFDKYTVIGDGYNHNGGSDRECVPTPVLIATYNTVQNKYNFISLWEDLVHVSSGGGVYYALYVVNKIKSESTVKLTQTNVYASCEDRERYD